MAAVAATLTDAPEINDLLELICLAAIGTVPRVDYASITLADRDGKQETPVATDPVGRRADALQYQFNQGPCVDAVHGRWQVHSDDLSTDSRWPR